MLKSLAKSLFNEKHGKTFPEEEPFSPLIKSFIEEHSLEKIDLFFAQSFSDIGENSFLFLCFLFKATREGHLCIVLDEKRVLPSVDPKFHQALLDGALNLPEALIEESLLHEGNRWYLKRNGLCEKRFLKEVERLKNSPLKDVFPEEEIESFLVKESLTEEQKKAVKKALLSPLTLICGGPGTGKSRTAITLIKLFLKVAKGSVAVAAPTGKAAGNLRAHLDCTVTTLQSLLTKKERLDYDLIVIDEGSMIDAFLMSDLFSAVKAGARLVILGDQDQLPPVGTGNFFRDLSLSYDDINAKLTLCLRAELQEIIDLSKKVREGASFPIEKLPNPKSLVELLVKRFSLEKERGVEQLFSYYRSFRLLSPQRKGPYGVDTLNQQLYDIHVRKGEAHFVPIIIKVNDHEEGLYNGDMGLLCESEEYAVFEDGRTLSSKLLPPYEYAYVLSIHKSQGSEYDEVMILLPQGAENFGKEMLYTAITRARKKVTLYGEEEILEKILNKDSRRLSGLQNL